MAHYGIAIDYEYCTGCHSCEVACQQEHNYPAGTCGIVVREHEYEVKGRLWIDYLPFFTKHCDLCKARRTRDRKALPSCVHHCQSRCLEFGLTDELAARLPKQSKTALFTHSPGR